MSRIVYSKLICKDGFSMSVQAGTGMYSEPRREASSYSRVEVGFPSAKEDLLMPYVEDPDNPTATVYGWVPADVVIKVINKHGGVASGQIPPLCF